MRYPAGSLDAKASKLVWVEGERKTNFLLILFLWELATRYPEASEST